MGAYYNEIDPFAAAWLRELIKAGLIADGEVDERSIEEVQPEDVRGFTQCHWFAGVGGWSYALRLAGWSDNEPVWTGSCPCQPFSLAGHRKGTADNRDLWPFFFRLAQERRPPTIFGEQVEGAIRWGERKVMADEKMKPLLIIPENEISKRDIARLNKNGFCVVEAKDPSKVRFSEPPPLSYDEHDRAAIELFRYVMNQGPNVSWNKRELASVYVELLLRGVRPIATASVERIPKNAKAGAA